MARRRRHSDGDRPARGRPPSRPNDIPDRRAIEGRMWGVPPELGTGTPAEQAQELMYQAFEQLDPAQRTQLARRALEVWPDCADAYILLAEHAATRKEALDLYEKGVAAGQRALGPEMFQRAVGDFWGLLETRPYMRARSGLADALWTAGRRDEAVTHLQDMLRLNPEDNQGNRYTLAGCLLALDRNEELGLLLGQYGDEDSATWAYTRALLAYRLQGDTPQARALLKEAKKANKHVIPYLLEQKHPPMDQPPFYSPGDENEALVYLASSLAGWKNTAGAIDWVRQVVKSGKKKRSSAAHAAGPSALVKDRLQEEDQLFEVWQADFRQLPCLVKVGREMKRPWVVVVFNRDSELILSSEVTEDEPTAEDVWDRLVRAMQRPMLGDPGRPTELEVRDRPIWRTLAPHLEEIGVQVTYLETLESLDEAMAAVANQMNEDEPPGLLDIPGMTPEKVGSFYTAAADFYRQAPWRNIGYESALRVECDRYQSGPWYGVLMGQSGLTMGFTLYDDLDLLRRLWSGQLDDEENARLTVATTVTFGRDMEIPLADVEAAKSHGWPVARPDAWPSPFRKERGMSMRPPLVWELELLEACLRAVPDFVRRRKQDDTTQEEVTVQLSSGPLTLRLGWIDDET